MQSPSLERIRKKKKIISFWLIFFVSVVFFFVLCQDRYFYCCCRHWLRRWCCWFCVPHLIPFLNLVFVFLGNFELYSKDVTRKKICPLSLFQCSRYLVISETRSKCTCTFRKFLWCRSSSTKHFFVLELPVFVDVVVDVPCTTHRWWLIVIALFLKCKWNSRNRLKPKGLWNFIGDCSIREAIWWRSTHGQMAEWDYWKSAF